MRRSVSVGLAAILAGCAAQTSAAAPPVPPAIPPGNASQMAALPGAALQVYTYRPAGCEPRMLLLVFHGVSRDAGPYRDHARPLADKVCAVIVAPEFDRRRFPQALYQYGGLQAPAGARTVDLVPQLARWAQDALGQPALPLVLLGHSAGAQFLDRVAGFAPAGAARIVVANPSTWVWPSTEVAMPFGFGGASRAAAALQAYLALPVTVLLGTADVRTKELDMSPQAMAQGPNRYIRGVAAFRAAQQTAQAQGWAFGWRLLEVPGVGHNATKMFASAEAAEAVAP